LVYFCFGFWRVFSSISAHPATIASCVLCCFISPSQAILLLLPFVPEEVQGKLKGVEWWVQTDRPIEREKTATSTGKRSRSSDSDDSSGGGSGGSGGSSGGGSGGSSGGSSDGGSGGGSDGGSGSGKKKRRRTPPPTPLVQWGTYFN
jgi:hypothetical protein